jgi:hypothetical protein
LQIEHLAAIGFGDAHVTNEHTYLPYLCPIAVTYTLGPGEKAGSNYRSAGLRLV